MRKTRKLNKRYRKTRRISGGGGGDLKKLPLLPPSPPPTPPRSPNVKKPELKVANANLKAVEPYTYNWWVRQGLKRKLPYSKNMGPKVPLNSNGYPIRSYFKPGNSF